ncbi:MAG: lipoprotein [Pseudomonadota bacterium]
MIARSLIVVLAASLALSACGRKGDPIPPSQVERDDSEMNRDNAN